ncbi:hypothetical protein JZU71_05575, partial [bacterium]|nr:hypothetical protein [bacterium]
MPIACHGTSIILLYLYEDLYIKRFYDTGKFFAGFFLFRRRCLVEYGLDKERPADYLVILLALIFVEC